jgi:transposase
MSMTDKHDKRHDPHPGYKGTKAPKGSKKAAFRGKLSDAVKEPEQYKTLIDFLETEARLFNEELTSDAHLMREAIQKSDELAKGNFYTWLGDRYGRKYLSHRAGCNNAWYFHNAAELIRRTAKQLHTVIQLTDICRKWGWSEKQTRRIQEEAHDVLGEWYSQHYIKNICRSKHYPEYPADQAFILDYGTQSKYTIEDVSNNTETGEFVYDLKVSTPSKQGTRVHFAYRVPERIMVQDTLLVSIRKPLLYKDDKGEWMFSIPYWYMPAKEDESVSKHGHLGVDAGFVRVFRGGIVYPNGSYIENLDPSEETESAHNHAEGLHDLKRRLYDKAWHKRNLAKHCKDATLKAQLECESERLFDEYKSVRSNYAAEREHVSRLVARDIVSFACEFSCDEIHVEDLRWVGGSGQSWNYATTIEHIEIVANRYGIRVVKVNAYKSSQTDPLTGILFSDDAMPGLGEDRFEVWGDGSVHDRDGGSGLELACRSRRGSSEGTKHERSLVEEVIPRGKSRSYGKGKRGAWMGEHWCKIGVTEGYRPSDEFLVSLRERRRLWREARKQADNLVVGFSGSVSTLGEPRTAETGTSQSTSGGPAHNARKSSTTNQTKPSRRKTSLNNDK